MIRVGILSFAHYHANFWAEAFRDDADADLVGIFDDDGARGRDAANRFGIEFFERLDELLSRVDAVAITSETARHRALIERAAAAGKHILCEKPIATTLADARAIKQAVAKTGVSFMQSFPKRFDAVNHEVIDIIRSGQLGTIWLARVRHGHSHGRSGDFVRGWWTDPALSGGGTLIDEGVHAADFLRWLFGEPESVQATLSHRLGLSVEDAAVAVFRWRDGLMADVSTGWLFHAADASVELYGTEGSLILSGVDLASRDLAGGAGYLRVSSRRADQEWQASATTPRFVTGRFHHQNAHAFIDSLKRSAPPPVSLDDGLKALTMILAAYEAAQSGRTVSIDFAGSMETERHG